MINRFLTIAFLIVGMGTYAQHSLTVAPESDFKVNPSGKVITVFTLDQELNAQELESFNAWKTSNASLINLSKSGLTITTEFEPNYNDRNVYTKLFYSIGVTELKYHEGTALKTAGFEEFFSHFGL
jgi:hypothetical protein